MTDKRDSLTILPEYDFEVSMVRAARWGGKRSNFIRATSAFTWIGWLLNNPLALTLATLAVVYFAGPWILNVALETYVFGGDSSFNPNSWGQWVSKQVASFTDAK